MPRLRDIAAFLMPMAPLLVAGVAMLSGALHAEAAGMPSTGGDTLAVTVTGLHSAKGQLVACLWQDRSGFPSCEKSRTARRITVPVAGATMHLAFAGIAPGAYAVTVVHDEDDNGRLKHNVIGMPEEGVGISNDRGGMPAFARSLVEVGPNSAITVRVKYLFG